MPTFSLTQIVTTAIVTFIISGLGGVFVARYLSRARPKIAVTSVGFHGDVVHLSDKAIDASVNDAWGPSLNGFVNYQTACARENKSSKLILELGKVKEIVDEWLASNMADTANEILPKSDLRRCPYFSYSHIGSSIFGMLRRRSLPELPVPMDTLIALDRKFDLEEGDEEGEWVLHLGAQGVRLPVDDNFSDKEKEQQKQIAESFSRGSLANIRHILQLFSSATADELTKLQKLQEELRKCIAEGAHLVLDVVISNIGEKPVVITPYCSVRLGLGDDSIPMLFRVAGEKITRGHVGGDGPIDLLRKLKEQDDEDIGEMFDVEPYLAEASSSPHISVAGGGTQKVSMVSTEPMGSIGENLVKHFELGTLTCTLTATAASGDELVTSKATFGKDLSQQQKQMLLSKMS
jgi:hypothetical protein